MNLPDALRRHPFYYNSLSTTAYVCIAYVIFINISNQMWYHFTEIIHKQERKWTDYCAWAEPTWAVWAARRPPRTHPPLTPPNKFISHRWLSWKCWNTAGQVWLSLPKQILPTVPCFRVHFRWSYFLSLDEHLGRKEQLVLAVFVILSNRVGRGHVGLNWAKFQNK